MRRKNISTALPLAILILTVFQMAHAQQASALQVDAEPPEACLANHNAPPVSAYYWPPDTNVKVYFKRRMFTAEQRTMLLAAMKNAVGSLDRVRRVVKVFGMVNAIPEFTDQPKVINGCSDLFVQVFGERGQHARSAVGMGSLPGGITVEIEAIVEVE